MAKRKIFLALLFVFNGGFLFVFWIFWHLKWGIFLSFQVAFWSVFLVVLSSYLHYQKSIYKQAKNLNFTPPPPLIFVKKMQKNQKIINFKVLNDDLAQNKIRNFALFFSGLKIVSYGLLVAGFLFLNHQNLLSILGYLSGISAFLLAILSFAFCLRYES